MLDKLNVATVVVIIGVGLLLVSLLADVLGIGEGHGFGPRQTMGSLAGLVIIATGVYLTRKSDS